MATLTFFFFFQIKSKAILIPLVLYQVFMYLFACGNGVRGTSSTHRKGLPVLVRVGDGLRLSLHQVDCFAYISVHGADHLHLQVWPCAVAIFCRRAYRHAEYCIKSYSINNPHGFIDSWYSCWLMIDFYSFT